MPFGVRCCRTARRHHQARTIHREEEWCHLPRSRNPTGIPPVNPKLTRVSHGSRHTTCCQDAIAPQDGPNPLVRGELDIARAIKVQGAPRRWWRQFAMDSVDEKRGENQPINLIDQLEVARSARSRMAFALPRIAAVTNLVGCRLLRKSCMKPGEPCVPTRNPQAIKARLCQLVK
jgi:hypothetical protein